MILTLKDLILYMEEIVKDDPYIGNRLLIETPGLPTEEYNRLIKAFPTLPESYLNFIKMYDVKQIELGSYQISVCSQKSRDFAEQMISLNTPSEERYELCKKHGLIYIAYSDVYDIYVAGTKTDYEEGEILSIDHELYWEEEVPIKRVAPDYETFLIICANKYQLQLENGIEDDNILNKLRLRLDALKLPREYYDYWVW